MGSSVTVAGTLIREGTGVFDTNLHHVLWVTEINDDTLHLSSASAYETDEPFESPKVHFEGGEIVIPIRLFEALIRTNRLEFGPGSSVPDVDP